MSRQRTSNRVSRFCTSSRAASQTAQPLLREPLENQFHLWIRCGEQLRHPALANPLAIHQHRDSVTKRLDIRDDVRAEENGRAAFTLGEDEVSNHSPTHRVQPRSGLVEDEQFWPMDHGLRQRDALNHAL